MTAGPPTLDYRRPATPSARTASIYRQLKQHDTVSTGKAVLLVVAGVAILWFMLSVCVGVAAFVLAALGGHFSAWMLWLGVGALLVPLLFWTEIRTRGDYFTDRAQGFGGGTKTTGSYGEWKLSQAEVSVSVMTELLLCGPRFVLEGIGVRQRRGKVDDQLIARAAEIVQNLLASGEGMSLGHLLHPGEEPAKLRAAVDYLVEHDWVGQSKDGRRVWLLSEARQALQQGSA